jgi:hypothetical protein
MIHFACAHCGRELDVPDDRAGQNDSCPHCGASISVPMPSASATLSLPAEVAALPTIQPRPPDALPTAAYIPSSEAATLAPAAISPDIPVTSAVEIPGYQILGELGRGGMGVIYKAWQLRPRRLVALKMILAGDYASAEALARFKIEAEAVARLAHPNIVAIHEVNEHQGRPYLTLEFVAGGNLGEHLRTKRFAPREAAELVEQLARAAQFAHRRGIVHRDLKPANVLLALPPEEGAERWVPKIADFGLAKQLDGASSLTPAGQRTQSGAILGTPGYMAPEQAEGKSKKVGPATDVYALGAVLYECLTGQPPFQGENMLDTLRKVATQKPVPPCQLRPDCPRELETICLKCLQKEPEGRYASAGELADELRRWLDGKPIQARPPGKLGRLTDILNWRNLLTLPRIGCAVASVFLLTVLQALGWPGCETTPATKKVTRPMSTEKKVAPVDKEAAARQVRLAAQRESANNLSYLARHLIDFSNTHENTLPPAAITDLKTGRSLLSWRVAVLPFIGENDLYQEFKLDEAWDSPHNKKLLAKMPDIFKIKGVPTPEPNTTFYQVFVGPGSAFEPTGVKLAPFGIAGRRFPAEFLDGTSSTILIAEAWQAVPWTKPMDIPYDPRRPVPRLGGPFEDGFHVAMADGTVLLVNPAVSEPTLRNAITRNDGNPPADDWPAGPREGVVKGAGTVAGTVTYRGKPMAGASITFLSWNAGGSSHQAAIKSDGSYQVDEALAPGPYVVLIQEAPGGKAGLPKKYAARATSPLVCRVHSVFQRFDVDLSD